MSMVILKSAGEIEAMKAAGRLSAKTLRMVGERIRAGVSTAELDEFAEEVIRMDGGIPAFKGYRGFPGSICASINEQVVHGIPSRNTILQPGDIISIDTGAIVDGWYGDNAATFAVGDIPPRTEKLLDVTQRCLAAGIEQAYPGSRLGDVGHAIQRVAEAAGFGVIREYVGHGIGRNMHEPPDVRNYGKSRRGLRLEEGMVLAIEPMINQGSRDVHQLSDGWTVVTNDGLPSAHFENTVAITADGPVILTTES